MGKPMRQSPILRNAVTLPQYFTRNGYYALGSGKIYHEFYPDPPSWQTYWPSKTSTIPVDPSPPQDRLPLNGIPNTRYFDWGPVDVSNEAMGDWQITDWVIKQLERSHDQPFFLGCGFYRPHLPWYVPQPYFDLYPLDQITLPDVNDDDLEDIPPAGQKIAPRLSDHDHVVKYQQWRHAVQGYLASISFMDDCPGRVIDACNRSPYLDNTVIVLWSNHGWHLGEKLHCRKFALWEEATHNPLMFVAPGVTQPGGRCDWPVSLIDIYPTLIDLCGFDPLSTLEGVSLCPLLQNPTMPWDRPAVMTYKRNNHSIRSKQWRYIRYADGTEELYDHTIDPLE